MEYFLLPVIAAFVGWITNVIAIRLLFRPYKPIRIPILGVEIQGVLPRRKRAIAMAIAQVVEEDLLSKEDLWAKLEDPHVEDALVHRVVSLIEERIASLYPAWFPTSWGYSLFSFMRGWIEGRVRELIPEIRVRLKEEIFKRIGFRDIVESKVNSFDFGELERIVMKVASKELRFVEVAGGVLGLLIGFIQVMVFKALR